MKIIVTDQLFEFLVMLYSGIIVAAIYDFYKVYRKIFRPGKLITVIQDLIYWIVVSVVFIKFLLFGSDGEIRGYIIYGFLVGIVGYKLLLSKYFVAILLKISRMLRQIFTKTCKKLAPFVIIIDKIIRNYLKCMCYNKDEISNPKESKRNEIDERKKQKKKSRRSKREKAKEKKKSKKE